VEIDDGAGAVWAGEMTYGTRNVDLVIFVLTSSTTLLACLKCPCLKGANVLCYELWTIWPLVKDGKI
jgi:hypothetical protein